MKKIIMGSFVIGLVVSGIYVVFYAARGEWKTTSIMSFTALVFAFIIYGARKLENQDCI